MGWSQIINTPLGAAAKAVYDSDPARHYHNWAHIERLYWHAEHSFALPYDADLDRAILAHDVIYDAGEDKERRSAAWLRDNAQTDTSAAEVHILKTITHTPSDDNRMVLLDLADFLHPEKVTTNLQLIADESCALYGITPDQFYPINAQIMGQLHDRIAAGLTADIPAQDTQTFTGILQGIKIGIDAAKNA